jgi:[protein-PII] uridylyltransferase
MVATYGERAVDVFYVQDSSGNKITDAGCLKDIEARLLQTLSRERLEAAPA